MDGPITKIPDAGLPCSMPHGYTGSARRAAKAAGSGEQVGHKARRRHYCCCYFHCVRPAMRASCRHCDCYSLVHWTPPPPAMGMSRRCCCCCDGGGGSCAGHCGRPHRCSGALCCRGSVCKEDRAERRHIYKHTYECHVYTAVVRMCICM